MENEIAYMIDAYRKLYEVENKLRLIVKTNMEKEYGHFWFHIVGEKRDEKESYYHELVTLFGKYPKILPHFTEQQRKLLYSLNSVRNKIAHSHQINAEECLLLNRCYSLVTKQPIRKRIKQIKSS